MSGERKRPGRGRVRGLGGKAGRPEPSRRERGKRLCETTVRIRPMSDTDPCRIPEWAALLDESVPEPARRERQLEFRPRERT